MIFCLTQSGRSLSRSKRSTPGCRGIRLRRTKDKPNFAPRCNEIKLRLELCLTSSCARLRGRLSNMTTSCSFYKVWAERQYWRWWAIMSSGRPPMLLDCLKPNGWGINNLEQHPEKHRAHVRVRSADSASSTSCILTQDSWAAACRKSHLPSQSTAIWWDFPSLETSML